VTRERDEASEPIRDETLRELRRRLQAMEERCRLGPLPPADAPPPPRPWCDVDEDDQDDAGGEA
jgi:hypothetical protein